MNGLLLHYFHATEGKGIDDCLRTFRARGFGLN